ncbi:hypothetical protein AVEN_194903-1 [Araneus ventricosus]|uniref:Uncharacterized protein n=1 Tax=Araneus ventricosus TaxID=182803 RepID=A0A4Y2B2U7_ARAVE|nr:hypothetical protein AVEN_194903-1 [Araneus ventricosus]
MAVSIRSIRNVEITIRPTPPPPQTFDERETRKDVEWLRSGFYEATLLRIAKETGRMQRQIEPLALEMTAVPIRKKASFLFTTYILASNETLLVLLAGFACWLCLLFRQLILDERCENIILRQITKARWYMRNESTFASPSLLLPGS